MGSVQFDGTDDYLTCGTGLALEKNDMSLTAWVNSTFDSDPFVRGTIFSNFTDAGIINLEMYLDDGSPIGAYIVLGCDLLDGGGVLNTITMDFGDSTGWKHVACIWDGTDLTPYVDGQAGTPLTIGMAADTTSGNTSIAATFGPTFFFEGEISDVNYYRRVLSVSEIETLYLSRMRSYVIPTTSQGGYWPLDDMVDGTTVGTGTFLNRVAPGTNNCVGSGASAGGTAYADFIRYK